MKRLTTNKNVSEMSMMELAIKLLDRYANIPNEFACDEDFDAFMLDALQCGMENRIGLIAMFYQNLWAMADLRERLKYYEDLEEKGELLKLPCADGDTVWDNDFGQLCSYTVTGFSFGEIDDDENDIEGLQMYYRNWNGSIRCSCAVSEIGKNVFLTEEEAQEALKRDGENSQSKIMAEDVSGLANVFGVNFTKEDTDKLKNWIDEEEQGERNEKLGNQ